MWICIVSNNLLFKRGRVQAREQPLGFRKSDATKKNSFKLEQGGQTSRKTLQRRGKSVFANLGRRLNEGSSSTSRSNEGYSSTSEAAQK